MCERQSGNGSTRVCIGRMTAVQRKHHVRCRAEPSPERHSNKVKLAATTNQGWLPAHLWSMAPSKPAHAGAPPTEPPPSFPLPPRPPPAVSAHNHTYCPSPQTHHPSLSPPAPAPPTQHTCLLASYAVVAVHEFPVSTAPNPHLWNGPVGCTPGK